MATFDENKDYTYLADKAPSDLHEALAAFIIDKTGVELTAKQAQVVWLMGSKFQASQKNKERENYRGLDEVTCEKRSIHMVQAGKESREIIAERNSAAAAHEEEVHAKRVAAATKAAATRKAKKEAKTAAKAA